jgi:hypothetical protein
VVRGINKMSVQKYEKLKLLRYAGWEATAYTGPAGQEPLANCAGASRTLSIFHHDVNRAIMEELGEPLQEPD